MGMGLSSFKKLYIFFFYSGNLSRVVILFFSSCGFLPEGQNTLFGKVTYIFIYYEKFSPSDGENSSLARDTRVLIKT